MLNDKSLKQLVEMSKESSKKLDIELAIFDKTLSEAIKNVPKDEKIEIEKLKGTAQRIFSLMKKGKIEEANALIKTMQDGSKGNR